MTDDTMQGDPVLDEMAGELYRALVQRGIDPANPPQNDAYPTATTFAEYQKRGGTVYNDPKLLSKSLIERVQRMAT